MANENFRPLPLGPAPRLEDDKSPSLLDTMGASVTLETSIPSAYRQIMDVFGGPERDPNFIPRDYLKANPDLAPYNDRFLSVGSEMEATMLRDQIKREEEARKIRDASGLAGFVSDMVIGTLGSISTYVPFGTLAKVKAVADAGKRVNRVRQFGAIAGASAVIDEAVLQNEQELRTVEESFANVVGAAALGAVLGKAVSYMDPKVRESAARTLMSDETIPVGSGGVGAQWATRRNFSAYDDPGQLKGVLTPQEYAEAGPLQRVLSDGLRLAAKGSAVARGLTSDNPTLRGIMATLGDGALIFKKQTGDFAEAVRAGGTVEDRIRTNHNIYVAEAVRSIDENFHRYYYESEGMVAGGNIRSVVQPKPGKMNLEEFREAVFYQAQNPGPDATPEVKQAAADLRANVLEPLKKRLEELDMLDENLVMKDENGVIDYFPHVFDKDEVIKNTDQFIADFSANIQDRLMAALEKRLEKFAAARAQGEADMADLARFPEEVKALQKDIRAEREAFAESEVADIRTERTLMKAELRRLEQMQREGTNPASLSMSLDGAAAARERIAELNRLLADSQVEMPDGTVLSAEDAMAVDNALRRRSQLLSQSFGRYTTRQAQVLNRIAGMEDAGVKILQRLEKKMNKFIADLESLPTEEEYAKGLKKLEEDIAISLRKYDEIEGQIEKMAAKYPELVEAPVEFSRRVQRFKENVFDLEVYPRGDDGTRRIVINGEMSQKAALDAIDAVLDEGEIKLRQGEAFEELTPAMRRSLQMWRDEIAGLKWTDAKALEAAERKFDRAIGGQTRRAVKIENLEQRLAGALETTPDEMRAFIEELQGDLRAETQQKFARLKDQNARLEELAEKFDPQRAEERIQRIKQKLERQQGSVSEWAGKFGAETTDLAAAREQFADFAKKEALSLRNRIVGEPSRVVGMDLYAERGPELARTLNMALQNPDGTPKKAKYLVRDAEKVMRIYLKTVTADMELKSAFGNVNAAKAFDALNASYDARIAAVDDIEEVPESGAQSLMREAGLSRRPTLEQYKQTERLRVQKEKEDAARLVQGMIERLRHQRAIPADADGYMYRAGRLLSNWNVLTMMGNVVVASLVEPATAVWNYGTRRVFKDALVPMVRDFKQIRISQLEARRAGANELLTQERGHQMAGLFEEIGRRSKIEKYADYMAQNMGWINGNNVYTQAVREFITPIAVGRFFDALEAAMTGANKYMGAKEAREVLAQLNIDSSLADRIWSQAQAGGAVKHNFADSGDDFTWIPWTEKWTDEEAKFAFHTVINREINRTVLQPGLERPLFTDASIGHKLLFQFQSFMWSAHTKILMSGMQRHDAHVVEGIAASMPLAAFSYYVDSIVKGRGEEVLDEPWEKWTDEMIRRSSFLGALGIALPVAEKIPALQPYVNFSERGTQSRFAGSALGSLVGPSFRTGTNLMNVAMGIDDPTQSTTQAMRNLTPLSNVTYLRGLFQALEEGAAQAVGIPEDRR